jgi:hypothetical protein
MAPRIRALLPALLLALAAPAVAGVPAPPPISTVPSCLVACPMGDIPFEVTVRDLANNPVVGATVVIDFSSCPGAHLCEFPPPPYNQNLVTRQVSAVTDATGKVTFPLQVGGTCASNAVRLYADGVQLAAYGLASPDQNGDGVTANLLNTGDVPIFDAKVGTSDPTADFDCDGDVDADDQIVFNYHSAQSCEGWIDPVRRSSWGRVKSIYR